MTKVVGDEGVLGCRNVPLAEGENVPLEEGVICSFVPELLFRADEATRASKCGLNLSIN